MYKDSFIAVPRKILNDKLCSQTDKLVLGIINSLTNNMEYCYANNNYFANILNVGTKTISNSINNLKRLNYIYIEYENNKRKIYLNLDKYEKLNSNRVEKYLLKDIEKNFQYNRKDNNKKNKYINNKLPSWFNKEIKSKEASLEEKQEMEALLSEYR